jgi:peptidoglycan/LPS O-acetylase OafA/YrhL
VLAVLWTISVEEQFYVVMPWLMKFFKRWRVHVLIVVILISTGFRIYYRDEGTILFFNTFCIMSDFAVGALIAWMAVNEHSIFLKCKKTSRKTNAIIYLVVLLTVVFYHPIFDTTIATISERLILGIGFGYLIFDQAFGENKVFDMSRIPGFVWLGKRAYGLYCFHQIGIIISTKILIAIQLMHSPLHYLLILPVMAFILTVTIASVSYRFFERPFLDWKKKFELN